jgi:hypothetical protein
MKQRWTRFRALSWWKQALAWVVLPFVLLFVAAIIAAIVDPPEEGGDDEPTVEAVTTEEEPEPEPEPAPEPAPEPEPAPKPPPAPKPAPEVSDEAVEEALSDLSAEDVVDLGVFNVPKFCRAYAQILSAGLGEDTAYGNFLRGYQQGGFEGGPSAREVFDELVSRC